MPGDEIVINENGMLRRLTIASVVRATKTQFVVLDSWRRERRFRKQNGREVGVSYGPSIGMITEAVKARILVDNNRQRFDSIAHRREKLADDEISAMLAALDACRASNGAAS